MSSYYFCKVFKRGTGLTFSHHLSHIRVEQAKSSLLDRNARISEIAFDIGLTSITNFNRTFKELVGESPSEYRHSLPSPLKGRHGPVDPKGKVSIGPDILFHEGP